MGFKLLPDADGQVFCAAHFIPQKINIKVKVFMVNLFITCSLMSTFSFLHPSQILFPDRDRPYGYKEVEVVPMPVFIGTNTKNFFILFAAPAGIVELVRCIKNVLNLVR